MNTKPSDFDPKTVRAVVKAVADAIRDLGSVPNEHLYTHVMGSLTLDQYTDVIKILKHCKLVSETNHVLTWTGGAS